MESVYFIFKFIYEVMNKIIIRVRERARTFSECIRIDDVFDIYTDHIETNRVYNGEVGRTIKVRNICSKSFTLPSMTIFREYSNGGSFEARINNTYIAGNGVTDVNVYYYGVFKKNTDVARYEFEINGIRKVYELLLRTAVVEPPMPQPPREEPPAEGTETIPAPQPPTPAQPPHEEPRLHNPIIGDVIKELDNRAGYTFGLEDFTAKYSDLDNHSLKSILLTGNLERFRISGQPIVGTSVEISKEQLENRQLTFVAPDIDTRNVVEVTLRVRDNSDALSDL